MGFIVQRSGAGFGYLCHSTVPTCTTKHIYKKRLYVVYMQLFYVIRILWRRNVRAVLAHGPHNVPAWALVVQAFYVHEALT